MKLLKILQDRSKTNVFVSNCVEEKKRKYEAWFFGGKKAKKNEYNRSSAIEDLPLLFSSNLGLELRLHPSQNLLNGQ